MTAADSEPVTLLRTYNYTYDSRFHDVLTGWNGYGITSYLGYPTLYKGNSLTWSNCKLYAYGSTTFDYDADNVRRTKTANGTTTKYYYDGTRLLAEKRGNSWVQYMYDHNGLTGFSDGGAPYLYGKNAQGDITEIYDNFGTKVASYAYDAWGNCTVYTGSGVVDTNSNSVGNENPFRYRGYYYDRETGLYYLINRYYDPETGRFISPDHVGYMLEQMSELNGCNLYAYCLNNLIMHTDPEGTFIGLLIGLIVGAVVGAAIGGTVAGVTAYENGARGGELVGNILLGAFGGAVIGGAIGAGIAYAAPYVGAFISGFGASTGAIGGSVAVGTISGMEIAGGIAAAGALTGMLVFSKGSGPRMGHNQHENKQFRDVMKELGIKKTDSKWRRAHDAIKDKVFDSFKELLEFIKSLFE